MQASESLGSLGWAAIGLLGVSLVVALSLGFAKVFYIAVVLAVVVLVLLVGLCADRTERTS
jgi:uncharacterized membrane protein YuzA (DUF378 family)